MYLPSRIALALCSMLLLVCPLQEVRFTLDRCAGAAVKETEGLGSWLTTEDHSSCEVTGVTPNTDRYKLSVLLLKTRVTVSSLFFCVMSMPLCSRYLNMSQVLQLGGVNEDIPYIYPQLQHKHFTGCIRNLVVDSKVTFTHVTAIHMLARRQANSTSRLHSCW